MRDDDRWVLAGDGWTASASADGLTVEDPATGEPVGRVPAGCAEDVARAVAAAGRAQPSWARTAPAERAACLHRAAGRVSERAAELAELVTREMGKPIGDARGGVEAGIGTLRQYAELGPLHRGRSLQGGWNATDLMVHEPRGVVAVITPWNDPVAIACGLIGAAVVTGNAVVHKPSERTPHTGVLLAELMAAELPPGVLTVVPGDRRAGEPLAAHPDVDLVAHVGSTAAGRAIAAAAARTGAATILENGGKDPLIVDAGVDVKWAAGQAATGCFANAGQICTSAERVYVHRDVADAFLAALVQRAEELRPGPGLDEGTTLGPLVDRAQRDVVDRHVRAAVEAGARVLTGGRVPEGPGAFYPPTVLTGCTDEMEIMREETFGPVAAVRVVGSFGEGLELARVSRYGLAATVLTPSMANAQRAWRELPVGTVKVNAVFGGAPGGAAQPSRGSGHGFGYGPELLDEMTHTKVVHLAPHP
ncbi:aldehyde dehydrogenase family protein [Microbispora sp. ATCC PTA-5024]|uniref:aldehyde dehydrogenase family protein n=1 Tax=Microbispora sp. ATCC PTA-5024 TaxID=316330 RepID=UPI0003DCEA8E|nr:aldehyde dehydrogenase family protein [Microbispora sp. ATCC PTA-5024]ETK34778.1 succinate-semialdehyde dehydrogenase [Microbispora sp. ATCC PTA-5024]